MPSPQGLAVAQFLVGFAQMWLAVGLVVGLWFVTWAIDRIDPSADGAYAFRPLIAPGVALLWPYVVWRWLRLRRAPHEGGR